MEEAPLYKAAFCQRRAERHVKHNRFDEATKAMEQALIHISEAYVDIQLPKALEVVTVLENEYKRQIERIVLRKTYFEGQKVFTNKAKQNTVETIEHIEDDDLVTPLKSSNEVKLVIDRTLQDFDARYTSIPTLLGDVSNYDKKTESSKITEENEFNDDDDVESLDFDCELPPLELPNFDFLSFGK